jgi:methylated-DNA-[protein]-cysteine S-methyltransferase
MTRYARIDTPLGPMLAPERDGMLTGIDFTDAKHAPAIDPAWHEDPEAPALRECAVQLAGYFAGTRTRFDLRLAARGTSFQRRVWGEIAKLRHGETVSYGELARRAGAPAAARATGAATGRNPFAIVVPCHRVLGAGGRLTGYAGGL